MHVTAVVEATDIDTTSCGIDMGCYMEPLRCIYALDTCHYILTWRVENASVHFQLTAKMYSHLVLWAAVGINDRQRMVSIYLSSVVCLELLLVFQNKIVLKFHIFLYNWKQMIRCKMC